MRSSPLRSLITLGALAAMLVPTSAALADVVVLAPLIPERGVDDETVSDVVSLISSELEFMENVDEVIELEGRPAALDLPCLDSTRCLGAITRDAMGDVLVAGSLERLGGDYALDLLFYESQVNRVLRRKTYTISVEPSELIGQITPILVEVMTGESPTADEEDSMADVGFGGDLASDDSFYEEPAPEPRSSGTNTRVVDRRIEAPEPPPSDDDDEEAFDPSAISFGSTAEDITFGSAGSDISYGDGEAEDAQEEDDAVAYADDEDDRYYEDDDDYDSRYDTRRDDRDDRDRRDDRYRDDDLDLDRPDPDARDRRQRFDESPTRSSTTRDGDKSPLSEHRRVHISVRGGYTNYGVFHFGTVGGELGVRAVEGLTFVLGGSLHIVNRELPPELQAETGRAIQTDTIVPVNLGILYRFNPGRVHPYIGADAIFSQYYVDTDTGRNSFAYGARARAGADIWIAQNVGINLDAALGFWLGDDWPRVDPRVPTIGFLPSFSGGFVFAF